MRTKPIIAVGLAGALAAISGSVSQPYSLASTSTSSAPSTAWARLSTMPVGTVDLRVDPVSGRVVARFDAWGLAPGISHRVTLRTKAGDRLTFDNLTANQFGIATGKVASHQPAPGSLEGAVLSLYLDTTAAHVIAVAQQVLGAGDSGQVTLALASTLGSAGQPQGGTELSYDPQAQTLGVTIAVSGLAPGSVHAAHVHMGSCRRQSGVVDMLPDLVADAGGMASEAVTFANVTAPPPGHDWYVNVHLGDSAQILMNGQPAPLFQPVACGDVVPQYQFQTIASPQDPTFTQLLGVNDRGTVAGYFGSGAAGHPNQGFTLVPPATFTAENFPAAAQTQVIAINKRGTTGGFYIDAQGATHGFVRVSGTFTTVDLPGTTFNQVLGLNDRGQAAGFFQDATAMNHAWIRGANGTVRVFPFVNSQATGINDEGTVVGFTMPTATTASGFIMSGRHETMLNYPGSTFTQVLGENNEGQIVGTFNDAQGQAHGFVFDDGIFQAVDVPGASATLINGINDHGEIVGFFTDASGNTVGFVATPTNA